MRRFSLTWSKDRSARSDARVLSLARNSTTFRQKSELAHTKAKHLSFASSFGRQRTSPRAMTQKTSVGTEATSNDYSHLHFYYHTSNIRRFSVPIQCYNLTRQYKYNTSLHLHTLYKSVGGASPQHDANTSGGSSEAGHFKSSRHHLVRREAATGRYF
jgi:hypothetical protein